MRHSRIRLAAAALAAAICIGASTAGMREQRVFAQASADESDYFRTESEVYTGTDPTCIFIGDSRTVGMSAFVKKNDYVWSAKNGAGFRWMDTTGIPQVEGLIGPDSSVVVMMGFNDVFYPEKAQEYASYINQKAIGWTETGARVYFVSVNPITKDAVADGKITNEAISAWNEDLKKHLSTKVTYIDTYNMVNGLLSAYDGVHYVESDYQIIYDIILDQLNETADEVAKETESLGGFVPEIMSVVKHDRENVFAITMSKPFGIKNVFYELEVYDPRIASWTEAARVKTTTVMLPAADEDMRIRARAFKSYRAGISWSEWSAERIIGVDGAVKMEKEHWWIRLKKWFKGIFA